MYSDMTTDTPSAPPDDSARPDDAALPADDTVLYPKSGAVIVGLILLLFGILQFSWAAGQTEACYYRMGAFRGADFLQDDWQRLLLAPWLHLSFKHWLYNASMTMLMLAGAQLVTTLSWSLLICMLGSLSGFLLELVTVPERMCLGLSGGTFALMGACLVAGWVVGIRENDHEKQTAGGLGLVLLLCQIPGLFDEQISLQAHFGGLFTGLLLGWALCVPGIHERMKTVGALLFLTCTLVTSVAASTLWNRTQPWSVANPEPLAPLVWKLSRVSVEVDVPATQVSTSRQEEFDGGEVHLTCGNILADPVVVSLLTWEIEENTALQNPPEVPENISRRGEPIQVKLNGHPFWYLDEVLADDDTIITPRWVGHINGRMIDLQLSISAEANESWRAYALNFGSHVRFLLETEPVPE